MDRQTRENEYTKCPKCDSENVDYSGAYCSGHWECWCENCGFYGSVSKEPNINPIEPPPLAPEKPGWSEAKKDRKVRQPCGTPMVRYSSHSVLAIVCVWFFGAMALTIFVLSLLGN